MCFSKAPSSKFLWNFKFHVWETEKAQNTDENTNRDRSHKQRDTIEIYSWEGFEGRDLRDRF